MARPEERAGAAPGAAPAPGKGKTLGIFAASASVIFGLMGLALFFSLPSNVLLGETQDGPKLSFNIIASEMFPFFTKNPESQFVGAYRKTATSAKPVSLLLTPQGRSENLFGLSRRQRAQGPELAFLSIAPGAKWAECEGSPEECVEQVADQPPARVNNTSPIPSVCGDVFLTVEVPVSWSYRDVVSYSRRVSRVTHVDVQCK